MLRIDDHETLHVYSVMWTIENTTTGNFEIGSSADAFEIELFPNPAVGYYIYARFTSSGDAEKRIDIYSIDGKPIRTVVPDGEGMSLILLDGLKPGIYIFNFVANGTMIASRKVMK
jgi:hypothetical protein